MLQKLKQSFLTLLLLASTLFAADIPDSGSILNEIKPSLKQLEKKAPPVIPMQEYKAPITGDDTLKVLVKKFEIQNNTVFSTEVLHDLIKEYEGKNLTILEIKKVADIITKYYRANGYFVARAYIPVQDLSDNIVRITVIEGVYGKFNINNSSKVKESTIKRYLSEFDNEEVISMDKLERQIFLINSLSGLQIVNAEIAPGETVGSSDFTITAEESKRVEGHISMDNYGNKYTGDERANIGATLNSPFGYGDALSIYILNSFTDELKYGRIAYSLPVGSDGVVTNIGLSKLKYTLGDSYKALDAHGEATLLEAGVSYPIIKTYTRSLDLKGEFVHRVMSDWMSGEKDKKSIDDFTLSLTSYETMNLFELPSSLLSVISFTHGHKSLKSQTAETNDAIVQSEGSFSKANLNLTHALGFSEKTLLTTRFNAQTSFTRNLDSSQELSVGGVYGTRAYSDNELSGDKGFFFSTELGYTLPAVQNLLHNMGLFYDTAKIWSNTNRWAGLSDNTRRLSDIGVSYNASYKSLNFKASYAHGFGSEATPVSQESRNKFLAQLFWLF
ncbi:ShlB/FhaC/HecB family hemolysin secretion/activation protein [Sulfurimonas crateris]|nr:ShlB/FhaC/HecB family hemolysin secretion/activation protein [Sulfurimonas crateris]